MGTSITTTTICHVINAVVSFILNQDHGDFVSYTVNSVRKLRLSSPFRRTQTEMATSLTPPASGWYSDDTSTNLQLPLQVPARPDVPCRGDNLLSRCPMRQSNPPRRTALTCNDAIEWQHFLAGVASADPNRFCCKLRDKLHPIQRQRLSRVHLTSRFVHVSICWVGRRRGLARATRPLRILLTTTFRR